MKTTNPLMMNLKEGVSKSNFTKLVKKEIVKNVIWKTEYQQVIDEYYHLNCTVSTVILLVADRIKDKIHKDLVKLI